jgi:hypothetical protein
VQCIHAPLLQLQLGGAIVVALEIFAGLLTIDVRVRASSRNTIQLHFFDKPTMEPADATALDRPLRLLTCLTTAICFPLNIAATILSLEHQGRRWARRHATAYCFIFIPLAVTLASALLSLQYMKKHGKTPRALHFAVLDIIAIVGYIGTMIPCWALELQEFSAGGFGLLTGYVTAPMILSM